MLTKYLDLRSTEQITLSGAGTLLQLSDKSLPCMLAKTPSVLPPGELDDEAFLSLFRFLGIQEKAANSTFSIANHK